MGDKVDGVYQLQGGVERYLKAFPDGGFWRGKVSAEELIAAKTGFEL